MKKVIDELFNGIKAGDIFSIFAVPSTGKTLMGLQIADEFKGKVLYIDTEGGVEDYLKVKGYLKCKNVEFLRVRSLERLMEYFNRPIELNISKNGRITVAMKKIDRRKKNKMYEKIKG